MDRQQAHCPAGFAEPDPGGSTTRYLYDEAGILAQQTPTGDWLYVTRDGLGSVRGVVDEALAVQEYRSYTPVGVRSDGAATLSDFGFTGEMFSGDLLYLRARYYNPGSGAFLSLDPMEGNVAQAMSLNRYAYVQGNVTNAVDPSGLIMESPQAWNRCFQYSDPMLECLEECRENSAQTVNICYDAGTMRSGLDNCGLLNCLVLYQQCPQCRGLSTNLPLCSHPPTATDTTPATATPAPLPTPGTCPTESLFGCYLGTIIPIKAAWIPHVHDLPAADFVPEKSGASEANLNWEKTFPQELRTVHAIAGGTVITNLHSENDGNYRIRSDQTIEILGRTYNVCYEYLHLEPIPKSPSYGSIISAGQPLGAIEPYQVDLNLDYDANLGPSHVHIAIWPCESDDDQMRPAAGRYRLDPLSILSFTDGVS